MNTKQYFQDKENGSSGGGVSTKSESAAEVRRKLTELENLFHAQREALDQAVDSIITIDNEKKVIFFNRAAEKLFGYRKEEVLGQNVKMIVPLDHQTSHDQYV